MKILLTGASGLVGTAIISEMASAGQVDAWSYRSIPLGDPDFLRRHIAGYDWLLHAAANTDVEGCEADPAACYRDNYLLTEALSAASASAGVRMAFVSSTGVYGTHESRPYREYDDCQPTTHHHRSKFLAESRILNEPGNLVVRTGWIFGGDVANPKNFISRRLAEASENKIIRSDTRQYGSPTYAADFAKRAILLMKNGLSGVFNVVNSGHASRYEYVKTIMGAAKKSVFMETADPDHFQRKAKVSHNEMAENWRANLIGLPPMPDWKTSLTSYIKTITGT